MKITLFDKLKLFCAHVPNFPRVGYFPLLDLELLIFIVEILISQHPCWLFISYKGTVSSELMSCSY